MTKPYKAVPIYEPKRRDPVYQFFFSQKFDLNNWGTVPPNNTLFGGTVPSNCTLFGGTPDLRNMIYSIKSS